MDAVLPLMVRLRELLPGGVIGEVQMLTADFGFKADGREGRLFDPALGGGALLDVGVYPVSLAHMILACRCRWWGQRNSGPAVSTCKRRWC